MEIIENMTPHRKRELPKLSSLPKKGSTAPIAIRPVMPRALPAMALPSDAEETIRQLEKVVSEFMIQYPSHTQRIPALRPGEHPLIAFVRSMAASMAAKQEQLEKLNQDVIEAAKEKERFFANMSHEVRTPMNGIFGMVNLLLEMDLDPIQREHLETIHSSSESLLNILDDILDYAKLNAKEMPLKPRSFELQKLIREVLLVYKANADARHIGLSATICETLPERFVADDLRLKQILSNLTSNAIKFTDAGEVSVTVQGHRKAGRDQLLFQVHDTGIGINEDAGPTLFAPFRQIDSAKPRCHSGTGLGLAISKNLVELMGGRIWFESEAGAGTTFFFTIDYETATTEQEETLISRRLLPPPLQEHQTRENGRSRVLLVEDNRVNQKVARLTLEQLGCDVTIANNGREAVDLAEGPLPFDLILMDVNMPVMDGFEATTAIRRLDHPNASVPIFAMTGMVFEEDRERCFAAGMNDVITKPFSLHDLRQRLSTLHSEPEPEGVILSS
jgi:signal transduction histidine kinase/ActR/RegA family two-component response regulator